MRTNPLPRWKRVVGVVVEVVEWTGVEESGGKIVGGENGLNATVFAILTGKRWLLLQVWGLNTVSPWGYYGLTVLVLKRVIVLENGKNNPSSHICVLHKWSFAMVLMVERNREEHLIHIFIGRGNESDPCDVNIASLKQRIQELEFSQLQQDSPSEGTETEFNVWADRDEEEEYPFVNKYPSFQEEPIVLVEEKSCTIYDTNNEEEESMPVYDTNIEDVIEEE
nr:hypothetical protein [Tanacetum cinerariifolium]